MTAEERASTFIALALQSYPRQLRPIVLSLEKQCRDGLWPDEQAPLDAVIRRAEKARTSATRP